MDPRLVSRPAAIASRIFLALAFTVSLALAPRLASEEKTGKDREAGTSNGEMEPRQEEEKAKGKAKRKTQEDAKDGERKSAGTKDAKTEPKDESEFLLRLAFLGKRVDQTDYHECTLLRGGSEKQVKKAAWVRMTPECRYFLDRPGRVEELKKGYTVMILGACWKLVDGRSQIRNAQFIVAMTGEDQLAVNEEYEDPKEENVRWFPGEISSGGRDFIVQAREESCRVAMDKNTKVIIRERLKSADKYLKPKAAVIIVGEEVGRPEELGATGPGKCYQADMIIFVDPKLASLYPGKVTQ